jgi:uncharacterized lipoprotein YajG
VIRITLLAVLLLAGCASQPQKFSSVPEDAPSWDLNPGRWPGTNNLVSVPLEAANAIR